MTSLRLSDFDCDHAPLPPKINLTSHTASKGFAAMEHQFAYTSNIKLYYSIYSISNYATAFLMMELLPTCNVNELHAAQNDHKMHQCHISLSQVPIAMEHQFGNGA